MKPLLVLLVAASIGGCLLGSERGGATQAAVPASPSSDRPAEPPAPKSFTLTVVGDIMLDRNVWKAIGRNGYRSILEKVREDLRGADITFGNLECPLSTVGPHSPSEHLLFRADPRSVQVLLNGGFDIVSLANNHTLNAGTAGLLQTLDHLEEAGVAYCGAHRERERSWEPCLFIEDGLVIGFVAATDLSFEHGSCCKVDEDLGKLKAHLAAAAEKCDLLVASFHWGNEYQNRPMDRQTSVARAAIEAGADLVIGHHQHVLGGIGRHRGAPILYGCGNFVFDQREGERMESAIFHLRYTEGEGWRIRVVPVWIPRTRMGPIYPARERALKIIERMADFSENLGVALEVKGTEGQAAVEPYEVPQGPGTVTKKR